MSMLVEILKCRIQAPTRGTKNNIGSSTTFQNGYILYPMTIDSHRGASGISKIYDKGRFECIKSLGLNHISGKLIN